MRGIIWRFTKFESEDISKSTWPKGIREHREFSKGVKGFYDVIGVWVSVENDDEPTYADYLSERVENLNNTFYKLKKIVILPFAHLTNKLASPQESKKMIIAIGEKLKEKGFDVSYFTFGTHKRLLWEIPGQVGEASYFEFPYTGTKPEVKQ